MINPFNIQPLFHDADSITLHHGQVHTNVPLDALDSIADYLVQRVYAPPAEPPAWQDDEPSVYEAAIATAIHHKEL